MNDLQLLRHFLASLAYRTGKIVDSAPAGFAQFQAGYGIRSPHAILRHMNGLLAFARLYLEGRPGATLAEVGWDDERRRFRLLLSELDQALQAHPDLTLSDARRLLQGPLSDAMTHAGQLAMLRRMAGEPLEGENFTRADIDASQLNIER